MCFAHLSRTSRVAFGDAVVLQDFIFFRQRPPKELTIVFGPTGSRGGHDLGKRASLNNDVWLSEGPWALFDLIA